MNLVLIIIGWLFAVTFLMIPIAIFAIIALSRPKVEKVDKKKKQEQEALPLHDVDGSLNFKASADKSLTPASDLAKNKKAALNSHPKTFGFSKSEDFILPPSGTQVGSLDNINKRNNGDDEEKLLNGRPPRL
jgi:hypothetical protein